MCFTWQNKLLVVHSLTKKDNFIYIAKHVETSVPKFFAILPEFSTNQNFCRCPSTHSSGARPPTAHTPLLKEKGDNKYLSKEYPCLLRRCLSKTFVSSSEPLKISSCRSFSLLCTQDCSWDIFVCPIPWDSYYNINMEYDSIKIVKFMKV